MDNKNNEKTQKKKNSKGRVLLFLSIGTVTIFLLSIFFFIFSSGTAWSVATFFGSGLLSIVAVPCLFAYWTGPKPGRKKNPIGNNC